MVSAREITFPFFILIAIGILLIGCSNRDLANSGVIPTHTATSQPSPTSTKEPTPTATNTVVPTPTKTPDPTNTPTEIPTHTPTSTAAPTTTSTPSPTASPTMEYETELVGVTFQQLPGFRMEEHENGVSLISEDGKIIINYYASYAQPGGSLQEALDLIIEDFGASLDEYRATDSYPFTIDGNDGLAADVIGKIDVLDVVGRIVIVAPEDDQIFVLYGSGIDDRWANGGVEAFDGLVNSIEIGHPKDDSCIPSSWDYYQSRTLRELDDLTEDVFSEFLSEEIMPEISNQGDEEARLIYVEYDSGFQYPSRVHADYTGIFRDISEVRLTAIKVFMGTFLPDLSSAEVGELFVQEGLFTDGTNEYWLPVQNLLIPIMEDDFSPGDDIEILVKWMGVVVDSEKFDRIYLVNEFECP